MDWAHEWTDSELDEIAERLSEEYRNASRDLEDKLRDYWRRFEVKDGIWQNKVESGEASAAEWAEWRRGQLMAGQRWQDLSDTISYDMHRVNALGRDMIGDYMSGVYAENFNFATWQVERAAGIDSGFSVYNRDAVNRIIAEQPDLLPGPGQQMKETFRLFDEYKATGDSSKLTPDMKKAFDKYLANNKDIRWQQGQFQSSVLQSILQGESIPHAAARIAAQMGEINHTATIRYARTAITGAQNAGRQDAYHRAEELGVEMVREWSATNDNRTRHEHRILDGQQRGIDEPFEVEGEQIMYPGDPAAAPELIWNCRCSTRAIVKGLEPRARQYRDTHVGDLTYEEWKEAHAVSQPITHQEEVAEAMKWHTIHELYD